MSPSGGDVVMRGRFRSPARCTRVLGALAGLALLGGGCGATTSTPRAGTVAIRPAVTGGPAVPASHPQIVEPAAGVGSSAAGGGVGVTDATVSTSADSALAAPVSDAVIRQELSADGITPNANQATMT